ncbi:hypothetical protein BegalDRAFT_0050 [Beggiatoa alba B18LD]|uniref:Uncharacterized protein n=1 Tax=Beggiatoa alba B18LD TaxID=395493 RepID=I3CBI3_9GAMM|nr:YtxH domain-containing protein [Beggiatoa alba]EIJ40976.1 hypothetical protein BegalDRAFT_0050 [Beggiatoa alba B18LD]
MDNQQTPPNPQITMNTGAVPPPVTPQQAPVQAQTAIPPYGYGQMPTPPYPYATSPYQCPPVAQPVQPQQQAFLPPAPPPAPVYPHPHYAHHHGYGYPPVYDPNNATGYPAHLYACYPHQVTAPQTASQASPQHPYPQAYYPYGYPIPYAQPIAAPASTGEHNQTFASFFNFRDERFLKGAITGAALTFLLTNESLQKNTIKSLVKVWNTLQGGIEEVKERFQDAEAELKAESQK